MNEGLGWGLFVVSLFVIGFLAFSKKPITVNTITPAKDADDEVKCELRDAYGRTVTITGSATDQNFISMCQANNNQQVYLYGYPYYFVRSRGRGHRGGGGHDGGGNGGGGNGDGGNGGGNGEA